jgi:hypothetical protein
MRLLLFPVSRLLLSQLIAGLKKLNGFESLNVTTLQRYPNPITPSPNSLPHFTLNLQPLTLNPNPYLTLTITVTIAASQLTPQAQLVTLLIWD